MEGGREGVKRVLVRIVVRDKARYGRGREGGREGTWASSEAWTRRERPRRLTEEETVER